MISVAEVQKIVQDGLPGAQVSVQDMTGTLDHFEITVVSHAFAGLSLIEQHRLLHKILDAEMKDRIHAVRLNTRTPQ